MPCKEGRVDAGLFNVLYNISGHHSEHLVMPYRQADRWFKLLAGVLLTSVIAFVIIPYINRLAMVDPIVSTTKENDIDAGSLFYSDVELVSESENYF